MACTGSGGKGTASVCKCMSNIGSTWNAYCHEIIITLTVTLLKVRTMTYMSWYVMICHVSCIQNDGMEENLPWYPSLPCVQMPSWSGWGEDTASVERRPCALTPVFGQLTIGPINSCWWPPTYLLQKIWRYVKDLWRIQSPPQGLAFWLWLYWAWGSLERSSTVQWNWCAVLTALERLWMKWKLMKHHDSNHDSQVKIQSQ